MISFAVYGFRFCWHNCNTRWSRCFRSMLRSRNSSLFLWVGSTAIQNLFWHTFSVLLHQTWDGKAHGLLVRICCCSRGLWWAYRFRSSTCAYIYFKLATSFHYWGMLLRCCIHLYWLIIMLGNPLCPPRRSRAHLSSQSTRNNSVFRWRRA